MTSFNFCDPCGEKRVKEVKTELENILKKKQFERFTCAICCSTMAIKQECGEINKDVDIQKDITIHNDIKRESTVETLSGNETSTAADETNHHDEDVDYNPNEESNDSDTGSNYSDEVGKKRKLKKTISGTAAGGNLPKQRIKRVHVLIKNCDLISDVQNMIIEEDLKSDSFCCKECKKCFRRSSTGIREFVVHINSHNAEQEPILRPYQCPSCPDVFKNRNAWKHHQIVHDEKIQCPHKDCGRKFRTQDTLENHVQKKHSGIKKTKRKAHPEQAICQICGAVLKYGIQSLKKHLFRHQGIKAFKCSTCNKSFFDNPTLVRHEQRHKHVKTSICEICGKKFIDVAELRTHLITHRDERTFQCEFCPYKAKRKGNLRCHIRNIHTNSDPNKCKCSYCGLNFVSATACTRHEKKHMRDQGGLELAEALLKPYQCPDCGYRAKKPCKIRIHQRSHTGEKPFKCTYCDKAFTQNGQCKRHMKICKKGL